jgi:hypothetical protein
LIAVKMPAKALIAALGIVIIGGLALAWKPIISVIAGPTSVGFVPWSSAVEQTRSSRTVDVSADVDGMDAKIGCSPTTKAVVKETATTVTVAVQVLNNPLPPNTGCAAPAFAALPAKIHLKRPIGDRVLMVGTTKRAHVLLTAAQTPEMRAVPAGFEKQTVRWDESSGEISEWWRQFHPHAQFNLDFGPHLQFSRWEKRPAGAAHTSVKGRAAVAWRSVLGSDTVQYVVEWTMKNGDAAHLSFIDQSAQPTTLSRVLRIARSVR